MFTECLEKELERLQTITQSIRRSGAIAPSHCWIEQYTVYRGRREYYYQRVASDRPLLVQNQTSRILHLGKAGCQKHLDWVQRVERRDRLVMIEKRSALIQHLLDLEKSDPIRP